MTLTSHTDDEAAARLHDAILSVLERQTALLREAKAGELPQREPAEQYAVHDHAGERCARCGSAVARVSYVGHETFYCPGCQTGGKPLKDRRLSRLLRLSVEMGGNVTDEEELMPESTMEQNGLRGVQRSSAES